MVSKTTTRTVPYRRKREGKTNYKRRLELLKSFQNRLVIRRSNKYLTFQIVSYDPKGDKVLVATTSKKLQDYGWKHSGKNLSGAYLAGLLFAKMAEKKGIKSAILDIGLRTPIKGSRIYSALKGVIEGGLSVPSSDTVFPPEERIMGKHINDNISKDVETVKQAILKL